MNIESRREEQKQQLIEISRMSFDDAKKAAEKIITAPLPADFPSDCDHRDNLLPLLHQHLHRTQTMFEIETVVLTAFISETLTMAIDQAVQEMLLEKSPRDRKPTAKAKLVF
jgi:hypothetical protein